MSLFYYKEELHKLTLFKKKIYTNDEIKLHIKRLEKEAIKLQKEYNTSLLREKEMFSKVHTLKDVIICHSKYGNQKDINCDIQCCIRSIELLKNKLKGVDYNE